MNFATAALGAVLLCVAVAALLGCLLRVLRKPGADVGLAVMIAASHGVGAQNDEWRRAMLAELEYIPGERDRRRFALGALGLIVKDDHWGVIGGLALAMLSYPWAGLLDPHLRALGPGVIQPLIALPLAAVAVGGWTRGSLLACVRVALWCAIAAGMLIGVGGSVLGWLFSDNPSFGEAAQTGAWMLLLGSASGFLVGIIGSGAGLVLRLIVHRLKP